MISDFKNRLPDSYARGIKKIFLQIRGILYSGNRYECNICQRSFRTMINGGFDLPIIIDKQIIGAGQRNHICPYCQSTDRDRLVRLFFGYHMNLLQDKIKILHIAPEPALYRFFSSFGNIDYIPAAKYHEGIYYPSEMTLVDLTDMHYSDSEFDIILVNHVLEHIPDDRLAMSEIFRTLRKGGTGILQIPYSNQMEKTYEDLTLKTVKEREEHFGQFDHVRLYGKDYPEILKSIGFEIHTFDPTMYITDTEIDTLKLFAGELLFTVRKPL